MGIYSGCCKAFFSFSPFVEVTTARDQTQRNKEYKEEQH